MNNEFVVDVEVLLEELEKVCEELNSERRTLKDFAEPNGMSLKVNKEWTPTKWAKKIATLEAPDKTSKKEAD